MKTPLAYRPPPHAKQYAKQYAKQHTNKTPADFYGVLRRRGLLQAPQRPGSLLRQRGTRLVHPCYRRGRPSDTGG